MDWDPGKCTLHQIQPISKELIMALLISLTLFRSVLLKSQSRNSSSDFMQHVTSRGPQDVPLQMRVDSLQKSSWNHSHLSQNHSSLRGKYKIQQEKVNRPIYIGKNQNPKNLGCCTVYTARKTHNFSFFFGKKSACAKKPESHTVFLVSGAHTRLLSTFDRT